MEKNNVSTSFFLVTDKQLPYEVLFHEPTSRFARVQKGQLAGMTEEQLRNKFPDMPDTEQQDQYIQGGEGRIGLTFMSARTCNLKCRYCFAGEGEYGSVDTKPKFYTAEAYRKAIKTGLEIYPEGIKSISFFGGEPLLDWKEIKKFIPECVDFFRSRDLPVPAMAISTNLMIMNSEIAEFMKQYEIKAVISLDGPRELNDYARISADPCFSVYEKVLKSSRILDTYGVKYAVQATVNKQLLKDYKEGDGVRFIEELGAINWENMAIVPVETDIPDLRIDEEDFPALDAFTREVTRYYLNQVYQGRTEKVASGMIAPVLQFAKNKHVRTCTSGHSVFCDTDGSIYPCQMFCNNEEYRLGDIDHGWSREKAEEVANISRTGSRECRDCIARNICFMWCKGIQLLSRGDMYQLCPPRCVFQKANAEECIKFLAQMAAGQIDEKRFWTNFKEVGERLKEDGFINE